MKLIPVPYALPGCCLLCRAGNNRDFYIDTEFNFEMYGAVYICNECLKECAENAGYLEAKHATQIQEENMQLSVQVFDLTKKADGLEKAINELLTGGFQYSKPVHREPSLLESIDLDREKSPGTEELVDTGAGAITESVHDEGVGELRSTSKSTEFELSI